MVLKFTIQNLFFLKTHLDSKTEMKTFSNKCIRSKQALPHLGMIKGLMNYGISGLSIFLKFTSTSLFTSGTFY